LTKYAIFRDILQLRILQKRSAGSGAAPQVGGTGGTVPPTPHEGHFCKSSKTAEKILGVWKGWRYQPYLNFRLSLSQVVFKDQI